VNDAAHRVQISASIFGSEDFAFLVLGLASGAGRSTFGCTYCRSLAKVSGFTVLIPSFCAFESFTPLIVASLMRSFVFVVLSGWTYTHIGTVVARQTTGHTSSYISKVLNTFCDPGL